ncbi:hypothetical protein QCE73_36805 [Caballeronia sp. LZ029]|uniref:hypothetical protein n=1 Tax=Caballeronia sp. LZ029 TaxID=3038564 RepID=UPI002857759C|nr:hypothetical protein [Caballeronia sp. LZ029]MDR5748745.1 hypothetical protein [Caballeronia sp. LZ029]
MAQDFAGFDAEDADDDDFHALPDPEVARIVRELDRTIMRHRRGAALRRIVHGLPVPLPVKPSRVELLVLTALVYVYGPLLLGTDYFRPVLDQFAECGAVVLLQQVVFGDPTGGEASKDSQNRRIAARLQDARPMFEALCRKFPGAFLADARALLKRFTTSHAAPREGPASADGEGPHG